MKVQAVLRVSVQMKVGIASPVFFSSCLCSAWSFTSAELIEQEVCCIAEHLETSGEHMPRPALSCAHLTLPIDSQNT